MVDEGVSPLRAFFNAPDSQFGNVGVVGTCSMRGEY
jgi:hypothetical protein